MNGALLPVAAVAAGVVSASSPCVLPVLPGYLAAVTSHRGTEPTGQLRPSITGAAGFVAGFTIIFTVLGATASAVGGLLYSRLDVALKISGALLIILGLQTVGVLRWGRLSGERRPMPLQAHDGGTRRPIALGAVFALGWTPCIGPVLATILTKAGADASLAEGMLLLLLYSAGLGIPFIALALWFDRSTRIRRWLPKRAAMLQRVGGIVMIIAGVTYISSAWSTLFTALQQWLSRSGWPPI